MTDRMAEACTAAERFVCEVRFHSADTVEVRHTDADTFVISCLSQSDFVVRARLRRTGDQSQRSPLSRSRRATTEVTALPSWWLSTG